MFVKGDKIITTKTIFGFKEGEIFEITDVTNGFISFEKKTENAKFTSAMSIDWFEKYFKRYEEPKAVIPTVTKEHIDNILIHSEINVETIFDKCTIVSCRLPNGFVIVESSACVSPENYDEDMGVEICLKKIEDKLWELEGYRLQCELYEKMGTENCSYDCNDCSCDGCDEEDEDWGEGEGDCSDCSERHDCEWYH